MKTLFLLVLVLFVSACKHDIMDELEEDIESIKEDATILYEGNFMSHNSYTVSGKASIIEKDGKKQLIFSSFSSTSGPDLKVYISKQISPTSHLDLGDLKALSGSFSYELPSGFELNDHGSYVLVYCERFSRLFGSAELKITD